jgi:hypothetical protein
VTDQQPPPSAEAVAGAIEEHLRTLSALAVELAVTAHEIRRVGSAYGYVPWSLIERVRETCDAIGLDWRTLRQQAIVQASMGALVSEGQEASDA